MTSSSIESAPSILQSDILTTRHAGMISRVQKSDINCVGSFIVKTHFWFMARKWKPFKVLQLVTRKEPIMVLYHAIFLSLHLGRTCNSSSQVKIWRIFNVLNKMKRRQKDEKKNHLKFFTSEESKNLLRFFRRKWRIL